MGRGDEVKKVLVVTSIVLTSAIGCMGLWYCLRNQTAAPDNQRPVRPLQSRPDARRSKPQIVEASIEQHAPIDRAGNCQTGLGLMAEKLDGDFTLEKAREFTDEAERFALSSKERNLGSDYLHETIGLVTLRLGRIEGSKSMSDEFVRKACEDLEVIGYLIERAWRVGNDPAFGENWTAMEGFELSRIRYERREAAEWRKKGVEGVALAHEKLAKKLESLMEANDGPLRVVFDRFCRHVDTLATRPCHPLNGSERWNAKKELLDTVKKYLGRYPKWGEQWLKDNRQPSLSDMPQ